MDRVAVIGGMDAFVDRLVAKNVIDRIEDRRAGAKRIGERDRIEHQPRAFEQTLQGFPPRIELARCRALKREDRLLLVTDGKDGAMKIVARAGTGREFRNEM